MDDQARIMAERIARRVSANPASSSSGGGDIVSELAAMRASLNELHRVEGGKCSARAVTMASESGTLWR